MVIGRSAVQRLWIAILIDDLTSDRIPSAAVEIAEEPTSSPSLWKLATATSVTREEAIEMVRCALDEMGLPSSLEAAVRSYASWTAHQIVSGGIDPYSGARKIWRAALLISADRTYDPFIYAASEHEERPEDRAFFERAIRYEAKRLVRSDAEHPQPR